ncbi:MAG: hypothetical protein KAJ75_00935 [Alphaproteobacteria bacterium]|nr:hypothetical protein [Alphaproteobacteria bacterium]
MDIKNLALFKMANSQMKWLNQRQSVIAKNVANANTPSYKASDLTPIDFKSTLLKQTSKVQMTKTNTAHMSEGGRKVSAFRTNNAHMSGTLPNQGEYRVKEIRKPFEVAVDGNAVNLEDQMVKMSETQQQHDLVTTLFKKHMKMITMSLGKR